GARLHEASNQRCRHGFRDRSQMPGIARGDGDSASQETLSRDPISRDVGLLYGCGRQRRRAGGTTLFFERVTRERLDSRTGSRGEKTRTEPKEYSSARDHARSPAASGRSLQGVRHEIVSRATLEAGWDFKRPRTSCPCPTPDTGHGRTHWRTFARRGTFGDD